MSVYRFLLVLWTLIMLLFRPASIGELNNRFVFLIFVCLTFLIVLRRGGKIINFRVNQRKLIMVVLIFITLIYFFLQGLLLSSSLQTVINASVVAFGTVICIAIVINNENTRFILKVFVIFHVVLSCSALISTAILLLNGFDLNPVTYLRIPIYSPYHSLVFPFSEYWSTARLGGVAIPRFVGIYREPGVAQIYFLTAYFLTYFLVLPRRRLIQGVLLLGLIFILSTASVINLVIGLCFLYLFNPEFRRLNLRLIVITFIVVLFGSYLLIIPSELNLFVKLNNISGLDRVSNIEDSIALFTEKPVFGHGYYNEFERDENGKVIGGQSLGLYAVFAQVGLVGIGLYMLMWWYGICRMGNLRTLCIYSVALLTLLSFQPTYNDVFVWFLLLINTSAFKIVRNSKHAYAYHATNSVSLAPPLIRM